MEPWMLTLIGGLLTGGTLVTAIQVVAARRKTAAEAQGLEAAAAQSVEGARIERTLTTLETTLKEVRAEVTTQRALREQDRTDFTTEVGAWREKSAACDERLAAEIRAREHEQILARERDTAIADLQRELTLALSDLARLSKRADDEDRRARDVVAASAAADLLKNAGLDVSVLAKIKDVQTAVDATKGAVDDVKNEVTTGNAQTLAQLAGQVESRRIDDKPPAERTAAEDEHLADIPLPPKEPR